MIRAYRNDADLRVVESEDWEHAQWLNVVKPTQAEIQRLIDMYAFPQDFLEDALDSEESSRIEYDDDSGYSLIISDFLLQNQANTSLKVLQHCR